MAFVVSSAFAQGKGEVPDSLFDKAVEFIKRAEGWHRGQMPYIGYGHCLLPGETLTENLSKAQADSLLRSDLRKCCDAFREFENDALLLGVLSYNVGIFRLKGHGRIPKSRLIRKLEKGERDIYEEYVSFRCYKGKVIPSIERRRKGGRKINCVMRRFFPSSSVGDRPAPRGCTSTPDERKVTTI